MISNNYIPEKINDANAYLDGTRMIGVAASVDLPEVNMKTGTVEMDPVHIFPINRDKENAVISRLFSMFSINLVQAKSSKNKGF